MISWVFSIWTLFAGVAAVLFYQRLFYPYFWKDFMYYLKVRKVGKATMAKMKRGVLTYLDRFVEQANQSPEKPFIIFEKEVLTYMDVHLRSNKFANVLRSEAGVKHGDIVALWMSNEPDFVCAWLGLSKLHCEVAFLNSNIKSKSLQHCLQSCGATVLIVGSDLIPLLDDVLPVLLNNSINVWVTAKSCSHQSVRTLLDKVELASEEKPQVDFPLPNLTSNFLFIFTSGTTGLPKAARISHIKAVMSMVFFRMCGANKNDTIYLTLPLYHMAASLLGIGGCIDLGATCILKKKFSASQFWNDCIKYEVTVFQYIGELCRYLINQPKTPEEMAHKVRIAAGSGLRADVWKEFSRRFGKIRICEAYGLTEASIGFVNYTTEIGPIGRASYFNKHSLPFEFLKCDPETYEPIRTDKGRCLKVNKGEVGLLVAPLSFTNPFLGYAGNKTMSEKKLLRDVFKEGDVYFNTGDLMLQDHRDFVYFKDRIGDTFRWKGENVATTEVSEVLGCLEFLEDVNVYGVTVPGYEGRAGMAAVVLKEDHDLDGESLYNHLVQNLPRYAWPWFLRVQAFLDVTDTFKQQKKKLVEDGFCPKAVHAPLYFLDSSKKTYIPLSQSVYNDIVSGKIRL
ncbi:long-chain fatty acid transport protein 6 [Pangasianodon hypophthalmus]|uniref:long-chain fatty acid transport protein 6 n=1 Tax=Pangasianodon hypophthalmus TaxID=310915 RepID=UPI000EFEBBA3|nr:long-chain fatty acid transport protein 6 [Pangasianodon hypophthalmus]